MRKARSTLLPSALCGGVIALLFCVLLAFLDIHIDIIVAVCVLISGLLAGVLIESMLKRRLRDLFSAPGYHFWMIVFLELNLFFGAFFGFIVGITIVGYAILFAFGLLFGYPGNSDWPLSAGFSFIVLLIAGFVFSTLFFARWFYNGAKKFIERKLGIENE